MGRNTKLEKEITDALKEYSVTINWADEAYKLKSSKAEKGIIVAWPYPLHEVYFDFNENNEEIFSESVEFYEDEPTSELSEYIVYVLERFFNLPWRIVTIGKILKRTELQVHNGKKWESVFD